MDGPADYVLGRGTTRTKRAMMPITDMIIAAALKLSGAGTTSAPASTKLIRRYIVVPTGW